MYNIYKKYIGIIYGGDIMKLVNIPQNKNKITNEEFTKFLKSNMDYILSITPHNPTISSDDEWNDSIYDSYIQGNKGDGVN